MIESVKDYAIFTLDSGGRRERLERRSRAVFGYPEAEIVGRSGSILWTPEDRSAGVPERERSKAEAVGRAEDERWHIRRDGSRFFASGTLTPMRDASGNLLGFTKIARDVTQQKLAEQELREADRRKDEFLAMLAHELRNPLAPISNALRLVHIQGGHEDGGVRQAWEIIERQVEHMVRLVDDLLDVSRISRGQIRLQKAPTDLSMIVRRAVESSRPLIDARRHELDITLPNGPLTVDADPVRLRRCSGTS